MSSNKKQQESFAKKKTNLKNSEMKGRNPYLKEKSSG